MNAGCRVYLLGGLVLVAVANLTGGGCSTAQKDGEGQNPLAWLQGDTPPASPPQAPTGPTLTVEIRREGYTTQFVNLPYTGDLHLQQALEKSGATKKVKRMELYVLRTPPQGGPRQRLTADYNTAKRRVAWESDYAVYPGDHIVVIEDTKSDFDHLVSRYLGPLGKMR